MPTAWPTRAPTLKTTIREMRVPLPMCQHEIIIVSKLKASVCGLAQGQRARFIGEVCAEGKIDWKRAEVIGTNCTKTLGAGCPAAVVGLEVAELQKMVSEFTELGAIDPHLPSSCRSPLTETTSLRLSAAGTCSNEISSMPVKMSVDDCKLVGGKMVGGKMVGGKFVGGGCGMAWCTDGKWSYSGTKECSKPGPEIQVSATEGSCAVLNGVYEVGMRCKLYLCADALVGFSALYDGGCRHSAHVHIQSTTGECKAIHGEFDRAGADLQALGKCRLAVCKNLPRGTTAPTTARPTLAPTTLAPTSRSTATPSHAGTPVPSSPVELAGLSENCAQTIDGGGWQLVRRSPSGWFKATDSLEGTAVYGDAFAAADGDKEMSVHFAEWDFDEFLFTTGDCKVFVVAARDVVAKKDDFYLKQKKQVTMSSEDPERNEVEITRTKDETWIQPKDFNKATDSKDMLYGEQTLKAKAYGSAHLKLAKQHKGVNVFVRSKLSSGLVPAEDLTAIEDENSCGSAQPASVLFDGDSSHTGAYWSPVSCESKFWYIDVDLGSEYTVKSIVMTGTGRNTPTGYTVNYCKSKATCDKVVATCKHEDLVHAQHCSIPIDQQLMMRFLRIKITEVQKGRKHGLPEKERLPKNSPSPAEAKAKATASSSGNYGRRSLLASKKGDGAPEIREIAIGAQKAFFEQGEGWRLRQSKLFSMNFGSGDAVQVLGRIQKEGPQLQALGEGGKDHLSFNTELSSGVIVRKHGGVEDRHGGMPFKAGEEYSLVLTKSAESVRLWEVTINGARQKTFDFVQSNDDHAYAFMISGDVDQVYTLQAKPKVALTRGEEDVVEWTTHNFAATDSTSKGLVAGRQIDLVKTSSRTRLHIIFDDMMMVQGERAACRWSIRINGNDMRSVCNTRIVEDYLQSKARSEPSPHSMMGYCDGLAEGTHTLQVFVELLPGFPTTGAKCLTGYAGQNFVFEAREVEAEDKRWSMLQQNGPLSAVSDGLVKARLLFFNKQGKDSRVLVSYHDNLQVKRRSKKVKGFMASCRWELKIDGASCPSGGISGSISVADNMALPAHGHTLSGFCDGLKQGEHRLEVFVSPTPGFEGSSCITGWSNMPSGQGQNWLLEARELPTAKSFVYGITAKTHITRTLNIEKSSSSSTLRLAYMDNLRATKGCWFSILVDGRECSSPVKAYRADPNNRFHQILGYCTGVTAGKHIITVKATKLAADSQCSFGFKDSNGGSSWTLSAEEVANPCVPVKITHTNGGAGAWDGSLSTAFKAPGVTNGFFHSTMIERIEVRTGDLDPDTRHSTQLKGIDAAGRETVLGTLKDASANTWKVIDLSAVSGNSEQYEHRATQRGPFSQIRFSAKGKATILEIRVCKAVYSTQDGAAAIATSGGSEVVRGGGPGRFPTFTRSGDMCILGGSVKLEAAKLNGTTLLKLPANCRPEELMAFAVLSGQLIVMLSVNRLGWVEVESNSTDSIKQGNHISLHGIQFAVKQRNKITLEPGLKCAKIGSDPRGQATWTLNSQVCLLGGTIIVKRGERDQQLATLHAKCRPTQTLYFVTTSQVRGMQFGTSGSVNRIKVSADGKVKVVGMPTASQTNDPYVSLSGISFLTSRHGES
jgi:hypothetical protein